MQRTPSSFWVSLLHPFQDFERITSTARRRLEHPTKRQRTKFDRTFTLTIPLPLHPGHHHHHRHHFHLPLAVCEYLHLVLQCAGVIVAVSVCVIVRPPHTETQSVPLNEAKGKKCSERTGWPHTAPLPSSSLPCRGLSSAAAAAVQAAHSSRPSQTGMAAAAGGSRAAGGDVQRGGFANNSSSSNSALSEKEDFGGGTARSVGPLDSSVSAACLPEPDCLLPLFGCRLAVVNDGKWQ